MESLLTILFIPAFLLLCFVLVWFLRFWIGAFVPEDETMNAPKKVIYTILGILFFIISPPITLKNVGILLGSIIIAVLIAKYCIPMLYGKITLFAKTYRSDIVAIFCCLLLFALISAIINGKIA